ncbi:hypothetical protein SIO70_18945 [Chitinophaga sancti]|uniref:hypothetical protein n=1 Tax=Chitinophaga sancti TaxID=1004 RepID=UPI002A76531F|nr:hypothetical protein [Chitinophaga sancti]WPQ60427.1 hypothetical protein SIO70_18945 [Chitinophaga sancti]
MESGIKCIGQIGHATYDTKDNAGFRYSQHNWAAYHSSQLHSELMDVKAGVRLKYTVLQQGCYCNLIVKKFIVYNQLLLSVEIATNEKASILICIHFIMLYLQFANTEFIGFKTNGQLLAETGLTCKA